MFYFSSPPSLVEDSPACLLSGRCHVNHSRFHKPRTTAESITRVSRNAKLHWQLLLADLTHTYLHLLPVTYFRMCLGLFNRSWPTITVKLYKYNRGQLLTLNAAPLLSQLTPYSEIRTRTGVRWSTCRTRRARLVVRGRFRVRKIEGVCVLADVLNRARAKRRSWD